MLIFLAAVDWKDLWPKSLYLFIVLVMSATTNNKMAGSHVVQTEGDHGQNVVGAQVGRDVIHIVNNVNNYAVADPDHAAGTGSTEHRKSPSQGRRGMHVEPQVIRTHDRHEGRNFSVNIVFENRTEVEILSLRVMTRANDASWDSESLVYVLNLPPRAITEPVSFNFGTEKPSVTSQVFFAAFTFGIASGARGWGKDYWQFDLKMANAPAVTLTTNHDHGVRLDSWFTNFHPADSGDTCSKFIINFDKDGYWISCERPDTGFSSRRFRG